VVARDARAPRPAVRRRASPSPPARLPRRQCRRGARELTSRPASRRPGEIGKNMTVVEQDDRIVVVDVGVALPDPEMVGIDLCCRTSPTCANARATSKRSSSPTAMRTISARCLGSARAGPGEPPSGLRRRADDCDGALEARRAQAAGRRAERAGCGRHAGAGTVFARARPHDPLDPRFERRGLGHGSGTVLITGDYKFDQTPVDGPPADVSRLAELGRDGVLLLCGDSTNVDRPGSRRRSPSWVALEEVVRRCEAESW